MKTTATISRRHLLTAGASAALMLAAGRATGAAPMPKMQVWKDPGCGCCKDWIQVLQKDGFTIEAFDAA